MKKTKPFSISKFDVQKACERVKRNRGSAGVDGLSLEGLEKDRKNHLYRLWNRMSSGSYMPSPVLQVEIPKKGGGVRPLGIPTVVDRVVQQAIFQVLSPIYEQQFLPNSYGFRPGRNAHQALKKCRGHITDGYVYAVDMDLQQFFDTVNHSKLVELLSRTIKDGRVISLIHKYLQAGVVVGNKLEKTKLGVPQGGPIAPRTHLQTLTL